jgi:Rod binding domain-containing protein
MEIAALAPVVQSAAASEARIDRAAKEFEALVLSEMLAPLFSSVETPGIAGGGPGEKAFASLLQEQYAKVIADRGGFGIADQVKAALINLQARRSA